MEVIFVKIITDRDSLLVVHNVLYFFQDLVKDLYSYRDRFFETHTIEKAVEKRELVEHKMREVLDELDNLTRKKKYKPF